MRPLVGLALAALGVGCADVPSVEVAILYDGLSVGDLHTFVQGPNDEAFYWKLDAPEGEPFSRDADGVIFRETVSSEQLAAVDLSAGDQERWEVRTWIDLDGDEAFTCAQDPYTIDCFPDLHDKQSRSFFTLLAEEVTEVEETIPDL